MTYKLFLAATLSLGLGTGIALAQSDTTTTDSTLGAAPDATAGSDLPTGWEGAIGDAFFSDADAGILRSEDEVRANFNTLTETQKAEVRDHCELYDTAAVDVDTTTGSSMDSSSSVTDDPVTGSTSADTSSSTSADSSMDSSATDDLTTGSTTADTSASATMDPMITASIERVCGWVDSM